MLLKCKKSIYLGGVRICVNGAIYDTDSLSSAIVETGLPFTIDFTNDKYFEKYVDPFKEGQAVKVKYSGVKEKYGIIKKFNYNRGCYKVLYENGEEDDVMDYCLTSASAYYFINSKGEICRQYLGKDEKRDNFCTISGNMFETKEMAIKRLAEIRKKYDYKSSL